MSKDKGMEPGENESDKSKKGKKEDNNRDFPIQEYRLVPAEPGYSGYEDDEIDLIELARTIWENRKLVYRFVAAGIVLGVAVALLTPKEYVSDSTLMPEYSTESSSGGASSLLQQYGGLLGMNGGTYNSASNAIRVDLYPNIVQSISFQNKLINQEFYFSDYDTTVTIKEYFEEVYSPGFLSYLKAYTIGLPFTILGAIMPSNENDVVSENSRLDEDIVSLSKEDMQLIKSLRERVTASLNEENGIISVSVKMPDKVAAAGIAKFTIEELTAYLTEYRTEKVLRDLEYTREQLRKAEERFKTAQLALADFRDSNQGNLTARALTEQERLQSEYDVAFNLYNSLTQQFEEAKLRVQEETPVFKVLQPVQVPVEDETSGAMILVVFVMLSGILSIGWIFIQPFIQSFKE